MKKAEYVVQARFVGGIPQHVEQFSFGETVYLGKDGQWSRLDDALIFGTRAEGEAALHEKWRRLRNAGDGSVILAVMPVPEVKLASFHRLPGGADPGGRSATE